MVIQGAQQNIKVKRRLKDHLWSLKFQNNAANYFKDQRRSSSHLSTVMFRGTPCIMYNIN